MPPGTETITQQWGAFGAVFLLVLLPLARYAWSQTQKLNEVQAARVQDAKDVRDVLLTATRDFSEALQDQVRVATENEGSSAHIAATLNQMSARLQAIENVLRVENMMMRNHDPRDPRTRR